MLCYKGSQDLGKHLTYYYQFVTKDIIKDANEQPDEEVFRVRSGRILTTGGSVPVRFEVCPPSSHGVAGSDTTQ